MTDFAAIARAAAAQGLEASALTLAADEAPAQAPQARAVVLLAAGPDLWARFKAAPEYADAAPDPLDRWSRRVAEELARQFGAVAILPHDGPPWAPFLAWAMRAEPAWLSRLGPLTHARRGLWSSWRGALALPALEGAPPPPVPAPSPCLTCPAPCLSACPAGAFAETKEGPRYDVPACSAHAAGPQGGACRAGGCLARHACPLGAEAAPLPERAAFHMAAFLRAHPAPG